VEAIFAEADIPADQQPQIALNREWATKTPVIECKKEPLAGKTRSQKAQPQTAGLATPPGEYRTARKTGRIGETRAQIYERYGEPRCILDSGTVSFRKGGFCIHVEFFQEKAEEITFHSEVSEKGVVWRST